MMISRQIKHEVDETREIEVKHGPVGATRTKGIKPKTAKGPPWAFDGRDKLGRRVSLSKRGRSMSAERALVALYSPKTAARPL